MRKNGQSVNESLAEFEFNLKERPFRAIESAKKKVEVRANKIGSPIGEIKPGNMIVFVNKDSPTLEIIRCKVERVTFYRTVRELLEREGTEKTLSSGSDLEEGIKSIESIEGYKEIIKDRGLYAIVIE